MNQNYQKIYGDIIGFRGLQSFEDFEAQIHYQDLHTKVWYVVMYLIPYKILYKICTYTSNLLSQPHFGQVWG
jgi:hypothetical protein